MIGSLLARELQYTFVDSDVVLCERQGMTVQEIVSEYGWAAFRALESAVLQDVLTARHTVLAVGGGAIEHTAIWPQLMEQYYVVWLRASRDTICSRMGLDGKSSHQRPSLLGKCAKQEVEELLEKRIPLYDAGSHFAIDTDTLGPEEVAGAILRHVSGLMQ